MTQLEPEADPTEGPAGSAVVPVTTCPHCGGHVQRQVDSIVALGPAALKAARDATGSIPIVAFDLETDPVAAGYPAASRGPAAT